MPRALLLEVKREPTPPFDRISVSFTKVDELCSLSFIIFYFMKIWSNNTGTFEICNWQNDFLKRTNMKTWKVIWNIEMRMNKRNYVWLNELKHIQLNERKHVWMSELSYECLKWTMYNWMKSNTPIWNEIGINKTCLSYVSTWKNTNMASQMHIKMQCLASTWDTRNAYIDKNWVCM